MGGSSSVTMQFLFKTSEVMPNFPTSIKLGSSSARLGGRGVDHLKGVFLTAFKGFRLDVNM